MQALAVASLKERRAAGTRSTTTRSLLRSRSALLELADQEVEQLRPAATSQSSIGEAPASSHEQRGPGVAATVGSSAAAATMPAPQEKEEEQAAYWSDAKLGELSPAP
jgi:hypothetical protein